MKTYKEVLDYLRENKKSIFWAFPGYYHVKIRVLITNLRRHLK